MKKMIIGFIFLLGLFSNALICLGRELPAGIDIRLEESGAVGHSVEASYWKAYGYSGEFKLDGQVQKMEDHLPLLRDLVKYVQKTLAKSTLGLEKKNDFDADHNEVFLSRKKLCPLLIDSFLKDITFTPPKFRRETSTNYEGKKKEYALIYKKSNGCSMSIKIYDSVAIKNLYDKEEDKDRNSEIYIEIY